jgi:TIR domain
MIMTEYKYDVFISYERDGLTTGWITEHFLPHFRTWLRMEVASVCRRKSLPIFFDRSQMTPNFPADLKQEVAGIKPGASWDIALREAMQVSRCMVGIWNPPYFFSDWCNLEWQSFDRRADTTKKDVLLAASVHDGNSFPKKATARQRLDFSPYILFGPALINSKKYEEFQDHVKLLAHHVAIAVSDAPPFEAWPLAEDPTQPPDPPAIPVTRL